MLDGCVCVACFVMVKRKKEFMESTGEEELEIGFVVKQMREYEIA